METLEIKKIEVILNAVAEEKQLSAAMKEQGFSGMSPGNKRRFLHQYEKNVKTDLARSLIHYYKVESLKKSRCTAAGILAFIVFLFVSVNSIFIMIYQGRLRYARAQVPEVEAYVQQETPVKYGDEYIETEVETYVQQDVPVKYGDEYTETEVETYVQQETPVNYGDGYDEQIEAEIIYKHNLLSKRSTLNGTHSEFLNIIVNNEMMLSDEVSGFYADSVNSNNYMELQIFSSPPIWKEEICSIGDTYITIDSHELNLPNEGESWGTRYSSFASDYKGNDTEPEIFLNGYDVDLWHSPDGRINADIISWETGEVIASFQKVANYIS